MGMNGPIGTSACNRPFRYEMYGVFHEMATNCLYNRVSNTTNYYAIGKITMSPQHPTSGKSLSQQTFSHIIRSICANIYGWHPLLSASLSTFQTAAWELFVLLLCSKMKNRLTYTCTHQIRGNERRRRGRKTRAPIFMKGNIVWHSDMIRCDGDCNRCTTITTTASHHIQNQTGKCFNSAFLAASSNDIIFHIHAMQIVTDL